MLSGSSHLDADLGLGSLERVELMSRLENAFGVRISDQAATQSNTPDELAAAVLNAPAATGTTQTLAEISPCTRVCESSATASPSTKALA